MKKSNRGVGVSSAGKLTCIILVMVLVVAVFVVVVSPILADQNNNQGSFSVLVFKDGKWQLQGELHFSDYETNQMPLSNNSGQLKLRLIQKGHDAASIDHVIVQKYGIPYLPVSATNIDCNTDVLTKILYPDYDVCNGWGSTLEIAWESVPENATLVMRAMQQDLGEGHGSPLYHPWPHEHYTLSHLLINDGGITVDGLLEEYTEPDFRAFWQPYTPHPDGYTYGWIHCDNKYLYAAVEATVDNTADNEDWGALYVMVGGKLKEFRISEDQTWGIRGFQYTSSVPYEHRIYEFKIPLSEINAVVGDQIQYIFGAYGTAAAASITFDTVPANTGSIVFGGSTYYDGNIYPNGGGGPFTIVANPGPGYSFVEWQVAGSISVDNPYSKTALLLNPVPITASTLRMVQRPRMATIYVNGTIGNDSYDGSSATVSGNTGPKKTIAGGIDAVLINGTVNVAAGTYNEHGLRLSDTMNLIGDGALTTIIDGSSNGTVIIVSSAPSQSNTISGFTIRNGGPAGSDPGGGIWISSSHIVTLNDCTIINNRKGSGTSYDPGWGGGICNAGGKLVMNRCTISGNTATSGGGGIYSSTNGNPSPTSFGVAELTDCTISENTVTESDGQGGGIWNEGTLTINRCCISRNHASKGNGIHNMPAATATLTNCTISGNSGNGAGGGIRNWGSIRCYSVTIAENQASTGGGFSNDGAPARMYFKNCIVASNTATNANYNNGYDSNNGNAIISEGYNIDSGNSCYFTQSSDQRTTNPGLGVLQNNGGPTSTHAITISSPAYNRGTNTGAPATDQRGVVRPQGTTCDIGAFELELTPTASIATATGTGTATFNTSAGGISNLTASASTACGTKPGFNFPHGFFSYNITDITTGSTVTITITLPSAIPAGAQYWKCINGQWIDVTSLLGGNDGDAVLTLTIRDGGLGDEDRLANGAIADPGGPALLRAPIVQTSEKPKPFLDPSVSPTMPDQITKSKSKFSVKYLNIQPQQALINQQITIAANMANSGDESGTYLATLKINGVVEQTKTGIVGAHVAQPIQFTVSKNQPGTYNVDINGQVSSFTINGNVKETNKDPVAGFLYMILAAMILAVIALSILLIQRRRETRGV